MFGRTTSAKGEPALPVQDLGAVDEDLMFGVWGSVLRLRAKGLGLWFMVYG
jgi:hypothetical protein